MNIIQLILVIAAGSTLVFGTIAIWILMGFYSIRILRSFRGGVLSKGWRYISIAVPFLILGQLFTGMGESSTIALLEDQILRAAGASFSAIGGLMIIIGLRAEHNAWNPKGLKSSLSSAQDATPQRDRS